MSGHSKWSTIKRKKAAVDQKRGKIFSKLAKEITVAAKQGGGDPEGNSRLRTILLACRAANMPKDKVEQAIKKGTGEAGGAEYEDVRYEAYGPGGVAIIVDTLTDNRNRTVAEIRHALTKNNGTMAESGAVTWNFEQKGQIVVSKDSGSEEEMLEKAIEAGAEDMTVAEDVYEITTVPTDLHMVVDALEKMGITAQEAELTMIPKTMLEVDANAAKQVLRVLEMLEDLDDVQNVYSNFDMSEEAMAAAMAE
jgi:YebC/PmpR family DNA-binding regulatory protein